MPIKVAIIDGILDRGKAIKDRRKERRKDYPRESISDANLTTY